MVVREGTTACVTGRVSMGVWVEERWAWVRVGLGVEVGMVVVPGEREMKRMRGVGIGRTGGTGKRTRIGITE